MPYKANIHTNIGKGHGHAKVASLEDWNFDQVLGIGQKGQFHLLARTNGNEFAKTRVIRVICVLIFIRKIVSPVFKIVPAKFVKA